MNVERKKQVDYLHLIDEPIRISHETSVLKYVPDQDQFNESDSLERYNLRQEIRKRKQVMSAMHLEIRLIQDLLEEP